MTLLSERRFEPYSGPRVTDRARRTVIPRFGLRDVLRSRLSLIAFVAGFVWPAVSAAVIYARQNATVLELFGEGMTRAIQIDASFFVIFLIAQSWMAFVLALIVGPPLIARDMQDNALPLYLSRPVGRADYIGGKLAVLLAPLSAITWIPAILLAVFQWSFDGAAWWAESGQAVWATIVGSVVMIVPLSIATLTLSALVQRRWVARGAMLGALFVSRGLAEAINGILDTRWGYLLSPSRVLSTIWTDLFGGSAILEMAISAELPVWSAWLMVTITCLGGIWLLVRRVRPYAEVRG